MRLLRFNTSAGFPQRRRRWLVPKMWYARYGRCVAELVVVSLWSGTCV